MLNSQLNENEQLKQLNIARLQIAELEEKLIETFDLYKEYKQQDVILHVNVEQLYYQMSFLRDNNEQFARITVKNNKIIRIEAATE